MRAMLCCLVIVVGASVARAQPGQAPYAPPPPAPAPGVPPPYAYQPQPQPQVVLTDEERHLLEEGEISDGKHIGGGLAAVFFGFGVGQAVQGRWSDTGYIFTLGEGASMVALFYGLGRALSCVDADTSCSNDGGAWMVGGLLAYTALHVWEIADAFVVPPRHNQRVRALRQRLGYPPPGTYYGFTPFLSPPKNGDGAVAGFALHF